MGTEQLTTPIINLLQKPVNRLGWYTRGYVKMCEVYHKKGHKPKSACIEILGKPHGRLSGGRCHAVPVRGGGRRIHLRWTFDVPKKGKPGTVETTIYAHNEAGIGIEVPIGTPTKDAWTVWKWFEKKMKGLNENSKK